ncbi:MAG: hypothetical protein DSZ11_01485, partial [Sulfurovum sp.]
TILINSSYSREFEREADAHAVKELQKMGISTIYIATLFEALEKEHGVEENATTNNALEIFSSHPLTHERIEYFKSFAK